MTEPIPDQVFLGWDKSLLESVKDWLLEDKTRLAETLVVVPTSNSGRRLRLALSAEGGGVVAPHVVMPSRLIEVDGAASRTQQLWAWVRAIQSIDVEGFPHLLPNHSTEALRSFRAAMGLARQMISLRESLADADKGFQEGLECSPEKGRWLELCKLEALMLDVLKGWKLRDPVRARRDRANAPVLPLGVTRIVVAGVPDPSLLALKAMKSHLAKGVRVSVLVHAPAKQADMFDVWGVPSVPAWSEKTISFPDWEQRMHVVDSATEAAKQVVGLFAENETGSDDAALALCDASFGPVLERVLGDAGWPLFDPDGKPVVDSGIVRLLKCCAELFRDVPLFDAARELVRIPGAEVFLPKGFSRKWAARLMDALNHEHLPETLDDARYLARDDEQQVIDSIISTLDAAKSGDVSTAVKSWLSACLRDADKNFARQVEPALAEVMDAVEQVKSSGGSVTAQETIEMLAVSAGGVQISTETGSEVLDMEGWLEISYDPASHLVLAGMHEGCVPDGAVDDVFVPDSLKTDLGMRDATGRCARDAFLLYSALQCREAGGRVDAVVARFNDAGEAKKPSRLLMRCQTGELPRVVRHLFADSAASESMAGAWTRDWTLTLPEVDNKYQCSPPQSLSPSAIKDYMDCPLRFFLKRVAKMDAFESEKREMDALDFGNLCHHVLDVFGGDSSIRDSVDAKDIGDYLAEALDQRVAELYGKRINLPLVVQVESARERLGAFAIEQAAKRASGWRIMETEFQVGGENGVPWEFGGHPIRMIVDRIDYNEESQQWSVWDYKTTGKAKTAEQQHLRTWKEIENRPLLGELYPPAPRGRASRRWADVQLPFYAAFVRDHFQTGELPGVGYVNLPRAVTGVGFSPWGSFDDAMLGSALSWAQGAIQGITTGSYQQATVYPAGERNWDDFAELAPDGLAAAFALDGTE